MRIHGVKPLVMALSLATMSVGCGQKGSSGSSDPGASSSPGTVVRQPLGASSESATGSARPTTPR